MFVVSTRANRRQKLFPINPYSPELRSTISLDFWLAHNFTPHKSKIYQYLSR